MSDGRNRNSIKNGCLPIKSPARHNYRIWNVNQGRRGDPTIWVSFCRIGKCLPGEMAGFKLHRGWQEVRAGCHPECTTVPLGLSAGASWGRGEQRWTEGVVGFSKVACRLFFGPGKPEENVPETQTKFLSFDHGVKQLHQVTSKNWVQHLCLVAHWHLAEPKNINFHPFQI